MCLQLCHVTNQIINNDLPCEHCVPAVRYAHIAQTCRSCAHYTERPGKPPLCAMTRQRLPKARTCCHWNVARHAEKILVIGENDIASGVLVAANARTVAELFDRSDTAPEYQRRGRNIAVPLEDMSVPEVYGVPSDEWTEALEGVEPVEEIVITMSADELALMEVVAAGEWDRARKLLKDMSEVGLSLSPALAGLAVDLKDVDSFSGVI